MKTSQSLLVFECVRPQQQALSGSRMRAPQLSCGFWGVLRSLETLQHLLSKLLGLQMDAVSLLLGGRRGTVPCVIIPFLVFTLLSWSSLWNFITQWQVVFTCGATQGATLCPRRNKRCPLGHCKKKKKQTDAWRSICIPTLTKPSQFRLCSPLEGEILHLEVSVVSVEPIHHFPFFRKVIKKKTFSGKGNGNYDDDFSYVTVTRKVQRLIVLLSVRQTGLGNSWNRSRNNSRIHHVETSSPLTTQEKDKHQPWIIPFENLFDLWEGNDIAWNDPSSSKGPGVENVLGGFRSTGLLSLFGFSLLWVTTTQQQLA